LDAFVGSSFLVESAESNENRTTASSWIDPSVPTAIAWRVVSAPGNATTSWTQRRIQEQTVWPTGQEPGQEGSADSVSLGLVNKVIRYLRDEGYVTDGQGAGFQLQDPVGLLTAWSEAYRFDRHDRHSYFTLLAPGQLREAVYRTGLESGGMVVLAAFSAAETQAPHVRHPKTWLYVAAEHFEALVSRAEAAPVDSGENLVLLIPDDLGVFVSFDSSDASPFVDDQMPHSTDAVQTYLDLLHSGGRGEEAAQAVLEQCLLPAWQKAGLA